MRLRHSKKDNDPNATVRIADGAKKIMAARFATAHFLGFEMLLPIKSSTLEKKCKSNVRARKPDRSIGQSSSQTTYLSLVMSVKAH